MGVLLYSLFSKKGYRSLMCQIFVQKVKVVKIPGVKNI